MSQPLDYKELLKKYMATVVEQQEYDFLAGAKESQSLSSFNGAAFTDEEFEELYRIADQVGDEYWQNYRREGNPK